MAAHKTFMNEAIRLSLQKMMEGHGGPFGAVIVKDGEVVGRGFNTVTSTNDPTAHAEINAIKDACRHLDTHQLSGCILYTSCEPCPMCLGAIYWARPDKVYYGNSKEDAASIGFDDQFIYEELELPLTKRSIPMYSLMADEAKIAFTTWQMKDDRKHY